MQQLQFDAGIQKPGSGEQAHCYWDISNGAMD